MSVCARPLKTLIAQRDIILPSLPPLVTVTQCPGIISQTEAMNSKKKRNRHYRRERRARERAERGEVYNHDARWATERSGDPPHSSTSDPVRPTGTATPYQPCGPRCTTLANLWVTHGPMRIRHSKLDQTLVNLQAYAQAYINRPTQPLSTTLGPTPQ